MPTTTNAAHLTPEQIARVNRNYRGAAFRAWLLRWEDTYGREVVAVNPAQLSFAEVK